MPIYVGYTQKRRTVRLLTAGGAQFWLCPPTDIELTAYVSDITNLRNHTFLWEQIKGPPVVLASTDTLSTSFVFGDTDDKTFRFYVDPGTNREQYKDVDIYYTPTSVLEPKALGHSRPFTKSQTTPNISQQDVFLLAEPTGVLDTNVTVQPAVAVSFDPQSLDVLSKTIKLEILTDPGYVVNPEIVYQTWDGDNLQDAYPLPNGLYTFRFHYDFGALTPTEVTSPYIICDSQANVDNAWAIDSVFPMSGVGLTSKLTDTIRFSIERQLVGSDHTFGKLKSGLVNADGSFHDPAIDPPPINQTTPRSIDYLEFPELLDNNSMYTIKSGILSSYERLDPSNIGS